MTESKPSELAARDPILKPLTDDKMTKISSAEGRAGLQNGEQFSDLTHLGRGVQTAGILNTVKIGDVIPRNAVGIQTWQKITALLAR